MTNSRSFPSADVGSDHQLVMANMKLKFKTKTKPNHPKRYEVFKLKNETTRRKYEIEIGGRFAPLLNDEETDANTLWEGIKSAINDTSKDLLGYKKPKKPKPWIGAEVIKLSEERSKVMLLKKTDSSKKGKYNFLTREIKRKTKGCKDKWMKELCANVDKAHQATKSKEVTIKKITNKPTTRMQTVKSKEGKVLTELQDVKNRWNENYEELYNNHNPVNKEMTDGIPQMPSYEEEPDILIGEVTAAIKKLTDNKAPGYDNTTAEELKATGEIGVDVLHRLCNIIWKTEAFPDDWGKAIITPIQEKRTNLTVGTTGESAC